MIPEIERGFMHRINHCLRTYLASPDERVHRGLVADAFAAGMRAAVTFEVPDDEIATEFEVYCEEAFTE